MFAMQCSETKCFIPPPEAPVFEPSWEEFKDPLVYIDKIRAIGERYGICKIRPPPSWEPPFAIDFDAFRFTPRIQKLNELEILSRVKMNYLDQLSRFWSLQGLEFKIPMVEKRALDLFRLRKMVTEEGGLEVVNSNHKWPKIVQRMGYSGTKSVGAALRSHYERIILPYDEFRLNHSWVTDTSDKLSDNFCLEEAKQELSNGEQTGSETKSYIKVPKARRMGSEVRVKGKHMLHCYTSGTKIKITTSPMKSKDHSASAMHKKEKQDGSYPSAADKYFCEVCADGDDEEHMLLCDGCDDAYHMNCLTPPLTEVPPGDWRCPKCLVQECSKPLESYGFEQSQQEYTLETFGSMADKFKADHFSAPPQSVPYAEVEKEYWRLVSCMDEDVSVEYGADIHAGENGSGFPTEKTRDQFSGDEEYIVSGWNLNNLPVLGSSLLQFVSVDISGMKVPWCYVGMCFSSFSWHTEDHWSYSINYLHRGEAKTWYGIPGSKADLLEECMKSLAPDLFAQSPDILHQLTTIMNPNLLMAHGVPIYRTDQEAGNFIITFPRSYHAGFNQGYNFAEAVNFCPADWVPMGRGCVEHYRSLKRQCVFSHDELLCQIAENAQKVDIILAHYVYKDLQAAVERERNFRKKLTEQGVVATEQVMFELQDDDQRQCDICNTTCFLSAVRCPNRPNVVMCIDHPEMRCDCDASAHCLVYRYTLDELESLLLVLKGRADQLDDWQQRARAALEAKTEKKKDVVWLKELVVEVTSKNLPKTKELESLKEAVSAAEVCIDISRQLLDRKIRSSNRSSTDSRNVSRLTVVELENFCHRVETLPCTFKEAVMFQDLLTSVGKFKKAAADILKTASIPSVATLEFQIDWGTRLEVDLPELVNLNEMLMIAKWMSEYEKTMTNRKSTTLLELRKLKNVGANLQPHPSFQSSLAKVMNLLAQCENLEQRAVGCLTTGCRPSIADLETLVKESETLCVDLPHISDIKALLKTAKDWIQKVEAALSDDIRFLILDEVKSLQMQGEKIPVELELLDVLHKKLHSIGIWKDELSQVFVDKSNKEILQDLVQEIDAGGSTGTAGAGHVSGQEINGNSLNNSVVERLAKLRLRKLEELRKEHSNNLIKSIEQANNYDSCFNCNKDGPSHVQQCLTCAAKYLDCWNRGLFLQVACEKSYVCPSCDHMQRQVAAEDVQQLVSSWRQLGFHLTEGKALEYLAAEVSRWQRMARLVLSTDEVTSALRLLGFPISNSRIWRRESIGEKSVNEAGLQSDKLSKTFSDASRSDYSEGLPYPIDLSLSSARKEVRPKTPEDLVQKLLTDSAVQEQLVMNMDLSVEAQATLSDLLLESRVLRVGTEEARVIGFLLFAAWQRTVLVEARRKEEELRKKREEEELRRKREEELRRKREEELRRKREEELRRRREEEELRRRREEELRRKREEEELRRKREEELRRKREEEELRRKLEEEELQRKKEEEELRRREEELRKKREEEELQKRRREELRRKKEEEDLKRKREEEMKIREEEERRKKKELEVHKRKEAEMRCEQVAAQMKKDALERKRFQELQRVSDEDRKRRRLEDKSPEKMPKKNSEKTGKKEEKSSGDNLSKNQENKKKNEENCEVQNGKNTKAKKRKSEEPLPMVEQGRKLKKDDPKVKDGQKKLKGNRNKKKKKRKSGSNDDDDDEDDDGYMIYQEPCAATNCLNPSDPDVVEWVQCDHCDQWYHLICQGLEPKQVSGNKQYFCPSCPQPPEEVAKDQGSSSTSEQSSPFNSPKSKKKNKEQNNSCTPQKAQNALSNKEEEEKVSSGSGKVKEKPGKNAVNKKLATTAVGPLSPSGSLDKLSRKNRSSTDFDVLKPGSEATKKKAARRPEKSPPKTASAEPISKCNSVFPGWSQQLTDISKATEDKDSRQEEGSKAAQNMYFKQYLYTPWLGNKSSSVR